MDVLQRFYSAFAQRDWAAMGACYHTSARFSDPVFPDLDEAQVRAMWRMLLTSGSDLSVTYTVLQAEATKGRVRWEARYTFSRSGRKVHNVVTSEFVLKDDRIVVQRDQFDFWRWSRQALGISGVLLGWTPIVRGKVQQLAAANLRKAMGG
ncbi:MAG: nuclear transport factor 2 family protein [Flavobacteriales bacterium]|nr:nuclear transport factor 2 family protein [Flavobacteriales bacterium]